MTESGAMQLLGVLSLDRGREADPATARLWARTLPDVPDRDVGPVARHLLREGAEYGRFPTCADVLKAWRRINGERLAGERAEAQRIERDATPSLPAEQVEANMARIRALIAKATPRQIEAS